LLEKYGAVEATELTALHKVVIDLSNADLQVGANKASTGWMKED
jgi:hypothetical protein